jgi:hypothetical protein
MHNLSSPRPADDESVEQELQRKNLNAPRLNPDKINAAILAHQYYVFPGTVVTVCCITLQNGFNVLGESAPVSPENFDADVGMRVAYDDAKRKIWALEGYLLKQHLHEKMVFDAKV